MYIHVYSYIHVQLYITTLYITVCVHVLLHLCIAYFPYKGWGVKRSERPTIAPSSSLAELIKWESFQILGSVQGLNITNNDTIKRYSLHVHVYVLYMYIIDYYIDSVTSAIAMC